MTLLAEVAWGQIIGTRDSQQDSAIVVSWPNGFRLLVLADGMGGHVGGDVASSVVLDSFRQHFIENPQEDNRQRMMAALQAANLCVFDYAQAHPNLDGMGATIVAVCFDGLSIQWVSVGDSPLWIIRNGQVDRLNENHSVAGDLEKLVEQGQITQEEAQQSPNRSQLKEAILGDDIKLVDAPQQATVLASGEIVILASDGVETCSNDEIAEILAEASSPAEGIKALLAKVEAYQKKSQDNATAIVMKVTEVRDQKELEITHEQVEEITTQPGRNSR